jgi:hypothetical protein
MKLFTMKPVRLAIGVLTVALATSSASAVPISGLYTTGVDNAGTTQPGPDIHYTIVTGPGTATAVTDPGWPIFPNGPWVANSLGANGSRWIAPAADSNAIGTNYSYQTQFTLPANAILSTAMINGLWATDDFSMDIYLNGFLNPNVSAGFGSLAPFMVTTGFQIGLNNLEFRLTNAFPNQLNPTGLRVERIDGKYQVPEPASIAILVIAAVGASFAIHRTRTGGQP